MTARVTSAACYSMWPATYDALTFAFGWAPATATTGTGRGCVAERNGFLWRDSIANA